MPKTIFTKTALKSTKQFSLKTAILESDLDKQVRKEIQRVFHAANRRIQNIEKSGVYSFAYQALKGGFDDRQRMTKFAKFSLQGLSDAEIKIQYAKAISFLQKPTSTASGARQHEKYIKEKSGLTDWQFEAAKKTLMNDNATEKQSEFARKYFEKYKDIVNEFQTSVNDVAAQIESDAKKVMDGINQFENELSNVVETTDAAINDIMESFKRFGM